MCKPSYIQTNVALIGALSVVFGCILILEYLINLPFHQAPVFGVLLAGPVFHLNFGVALIGIYAFKQRMIIASLIAFTLIYLFIHPASTWAVSSGVRFLAISLTPILIAHLLIHFIRFPKDEVVQQKVLLSGMIAVLAIAAIRITATFIEPSFPALVTDIILYGVAQLAGLGVIILSGVAYLRLGRDRVTAR